MSLDLARKCLDFLYEQVQANKIPQIKKGMVEDLEHFATSLLDEIESRKVADRMAQQKAVNEKTAKDLESKN